MADNRSSVTGLSSEEAKEYHSFFMTYTIVYIIVALVAHFLVWQWRPWFPSVKGYALLENVTNTVTTLIG